MPSVVLDWSASAGATKYNVYRSMTLGDAGTVIASPATPGYTDTAVVVGATYYYAVNAENISGTSPLTAQVPASIGNDADFIARRTASGVVRWWSFDDNSQLGTLGASGNFGIFSNSGNSSYLPVIDTSVYASGTGSLRFDVPSASFPDAQWYGNFSPDYSVRFGQNSKFYVQWRQRFDTNFVNTVFKEADSSDQEGIKQLILGPGDVPPVRWGSCEAIHCVTQTYYQSRFPIGYNSCTGTPDRPPYAGFYTTDSPERLQNGTAPYCLYPPSTSAPSIPPGCIGWHANEWMTFEIEITLGPRNDVTQEFENSTYRLWIARESQDFALVINWNPSVNGYFQLAAGPAVEDQQFGKVWLLPYMTNLDPAFVHPLCQTWYDELIISTEPIVAPITGTPPPGTASPTFPAWRVNQPVGTWFQIANTSSMQPIPAPWQPPFSLPHGGPVHDIINAWNGLMRGGTTWYSNKAGGDGNWQNATTSIDLNVDAPQWTLVAAGSAFSAVNPTLPYYNDGRPVSIHTYFSQAVVANRLMTFGDYAAYAINNPGYGAGRYINSFNLSTGDYDPAGTWANIPSSFGWDMSRSIAVCRDPNTQIVWLAASYFFAKWDSGTWTTITPSTGGVTFLAFDGYATCIDTKRNRWVGLHDGSPYYNVGVVRLQVIDLTTHVMTEIPLAGTMPTSPLLNNCAMTYDQDGDRYLVQQGTSVFAVTPTTGSSTLIGTLPAAFNGPWNRFEYFPDLGGVAYLPEYASNIYFMPTR
jgi:hypothetical protein